MLLLDFEKKLSYLCFEDCEIKLKVNFNLALHNTTHHSKFALTNYYFKRYNFLFNFQHL